MTTTERTNGPVRTCVGCRQRAPQRSLVRFTRTDDGVEADGPSAGRGAWVCRGSGGDLVDTRCLQRGLRSGGFERAWRHRLDDDERRRIEDAAAGTSGAGRRTDAR